MKRPLIALAAGLSAYAVAFASAATIGAVTDSGVGAGNADVSTCDTDGVNTAYVTEYTANVGYTVKSVSVSNINAACNGKAIQVTVSKGDGTTPAGGTGSVTNGAASVTVTPATPASDTAKVFVVIG